MAVELYLLCCFEDLTDKSVLIPLKHNFELKF